MQRTLASFCRYSLPWAEEPRNSVSILRCGDCARFHLLTCPVTSFWLYGSLGKKKCRFRQNTVPANGC